MGHLGYYLLNMFFTKSCEYALKATMYLAKLNQEEKVGIKVIAKELDLPPDYLSKILQSLTKHKLVSSTKGRNGGFYLTNNELNQPLIKIVHAIDGDKTFKKCGLGIKDCSSKRPCPLHDEIKEYRNNLRRLFANKSIGSTREGIISGEVFLSK